LNEKLNEAEEVLAEVEHIQVHQVLEQAAQYLCRKLGQLDIESGLSGPGKATKKFSQEADAHDVEYFAL